MHRHTVIDTAGLDTELARMLHRAGRLDKDSLQQHLTVSRSARGQGGATLARTLIGRGLISEQEASTFLSQIAGLHATHPSASTGHGTRHGPGSTTGASTGRMGSSPAATRAQRSTGRFPATTVWGVGGTVGGFRIVERLGAGSNGVVFLVEHTNGQRYALKTLVSGAGEETRERFARESEAQLAAGNHPNVVRVLARGEEGGRPYLVMEFVKGGDLQQRMKAGPLEIAEAVCIAQGIARGLVHMHQANVLHRDLKPANVLLDEAGTPRLVDFGMARLDGTKSITATGDIIGTPIFMSPEQALGHRHEVGPKTDVYALGVILYYLITGRPPFMGSTTIDVLRKVIEEEPPSMSYLRPGVPKALQALCQETLAKDSSERPTPSKLIEDLDAILKTAPSTVADGPAAAEERSRLPLIAALAGAALCVLLGIVGLVVALSGDRPGDVPELAASNAPTDIEASSPTDAIPAADATPVEPSTGDPVWAIPEGSALRYSLKVESRLTIGKHTVRGKRLLVFRWEAIDSDEGWSEDEDEDEGEGEDEDDGDWEEDEDALTVKVTLEALRVYAKAEGPFTKDALGMLTYLNVDFDSRTKGEKQLFSEAIGKSFTLELDKATGKVLGVYNVDALQDAIMKTAPSPDPMTMMAGMPDVPRARLMVPELDPAGLRDTLNSVMDTLPGPSGTAREWQRDRALLVGTLYLPPSLTVGINMPVLKPRVTRGRHGSGLLSWDAYRKVPRTRSGLKGFRKQAGSATYVATHLESGKFTEEFGGEMPGPVEVDLEKMAINRHNDGDDIDEDEYRGKRELLDFKGEIRGSLELLP